MSGQNIIKNPLSFALQMADKMPYAYDKADLYSLISGKLLVLSDKETAGKNLEKAFEAVSGVSDLSLKTIALSGLAGKFREMEDDKRADETLASAIDNLQHIQERHSMVKALLSVADAHWKAQEYDEEYQMLHQAMNTAIEVEDDTLKAGLMQEVALKYLAVGEFNMAMQIARSIEIAYWRALTLGKIGARLIDVEQEDEGMVCLTEAQNIIDEMKHPNVKAETLAEIAGCYIDAGKNDEVFKYLDEATKLLDDIQEDFIKAGTMTNLAAMYGIAGKTEEAERMFSQARTLTANVQPPYLRLFHLIVSSEKMTLAGIFEKAGIILIDAVKQAGKEEDQRIKLSLLKEAVKAYRNLSNRVISHNILRAFIDTVKTVEDANMKTWVIARIVTDYGVFGGGYDAEMQKILEEITAMCG